MTHAPLVGINEGYIADSFLQVHVRDPHYTEQQQSPKNNHLPPPVGQPGKERC